VAKLEKLFVGAEGDLDDNTNVSALKWGEPPKVSQGPEIPVSEKGTQADGFADGLDIDKS
jgi:hypothetical protein